MNEAVAELERTTQRNAELVEGARSSAVTLNQQAVALMKCVSGYELGIREYGTAEEAVAMVRRAAQFARERGRGALVSEVNKLGQGSFIDRDLYLMVLDGTATFLAHGNNPRVIGLGHDAKDADGKFFVQDMVRIAGQRNCAWVDYKYAHPVTNAVLTKRTYVERVGDVFIACGIYAQGG